METKSKHDLNLHRRLQIIQKNISPVAIFTLGLHDDGRYDIIKVEAVNISNSTEVCDEEDEIISCPTSQRKNIERSVPSYIG